VDKEESFNFEKKNLRSTPFGSKKLQMAMGQKENPEKGPQVFFLFLLPGALPGILDPNENDQPKILVSDRLLARLALLSRLALLDGLLLGLKAAGRRLLKAPPIGPPFGASEFSEAQKKSFCTSLVVFMYLKASKKSLQKGTCWRV